MDFNQYNSNQQVPPYPQPTFDFRTNNPVASGKAGPTSILDTKDSENSFVNSVLRTALNKRAKFYFSYPDSIKWRDMVYDGKLLVVGEDYMVVRETTTNHLHVLLLLYLEYVVFEEE